MTIKPRILTIGGVRVSVTRKAIKNLHLGVYPPDGRVRVAAPLAVSDSAVRVAVVGRLRWIRRQQAAFDQQARESRREMVSGESHYFLGRRYRLEVLDATTAYGVTIRNRRIIELHSRPEHDAEQREHALHRWYRDRLRELIPPILEKWEGALGVEVADWGIKRMKTKWGSCNAEARRIWLNLELAKKPPELLEYVIAHELTHLIAHKHDDHFLSLMDRHLPLWRAHRKQLNAEPLGHATWRS